MEQEIHEIFIHKNNPLPMIYATDFGIPLGIAEGVPAYSNCRADHESEEYFWHAPPGSGEAVRSGMKWQCVEYARRYLQITKNLTFENVNGAEDIWFLDYAADLQTGKPVSFASFPNGEAKKPPCAGSLLIYPRGSEAPYGHVAVIVRTDPDFVYIAEQNWTNDLWLGENYSRKLKIVHEASGYRIEDTDGFPILGWKTA